MHSDKLEAGTIMIAGDGGDSIEAYLAQPLGFSSIGSVVVIHHMPGYDEPTKEITRSLAAHGFLALCPNLYSREAPGADPATAAATVRELGGVPDDRLVGDVNDAATYLRGLPAANGKVAVLGFCSGGRQALLSACRLELSAAIDCYGAFVLRNLPEGLPLKMEPIGHLVRGLSCPLLGIFGEEDQNPAPDEVEELSKLLEDNGKVFEFHTYEDAGHAFLATDRVNYRPEPAVEAWGRIWDFLGRHVTSA